MTFLTTAWEWLRSHALALPHLAKFAVGMAIIVGIPPLCRRARLPAVVGLLLSGVVLGPYVLRIFGERMPIADFFAELIRKATQKNSSPFRFLCVITSFIT